MTLYVLFEQRFISEPDRDTVFVASDLDNIRAYFQARPLLPRQAFYVVRFTAGQERAHIVDHALWSPR
jgi:hypothetical protein